jgi:hypothetical protein
MTTTPDVIDMVERTLKADGFDGLFSEDGECACTVDDLAPCGEIQGSCSAGYSVACGANSDGGCTVQDGCEGGADPLFSFHILARKPK